MSCRSHWDIFSSWDNTDLQDADRLPEIISAIRAIRNSLCSVESAEILHARGFSECVASKIKQIVESFSQISDPESMSSKTLEISVIVPVVIPMLQAASNFLSCSEVKVCLTKMI